MIRIAFGVQVPRGLGRHGFHYGAARIQATGSGAPPLRATVKRLDNRSQALEVTALSARR
jgi:hypothetical protein